MLRRREVSARYLFFISTVLMVWVGHALADRGHYTLKPGDALRISVWGEEQLAREMRVLPDGSVTFPLVGRLVVGGLTLEEATELLTPAISDYVPSPEVSVDVLEAAGSRFYVIGKVLNPGSQMLDGPLTVVQGLALAGGLQTFADDNSILLIRDMPGEEQTTLAVDYSAIAKGELSTNYRLVAGDVIVVP